LVSAAEQTFTVDSLKTGTQYKLQIVAADLAGNYTQTAADTFIYDTTFVVPVISKFEVAAATYGKASPLAAGASNVLTITAKTAANKTAVTYKEDAVLQVAGGGGLSFAGTGLDTSANPRLLATLKADDWVVGTRTVTITNTTSIDTLMVTVSDCTDASNLYLGSLKAGEVDSAIFYHPAIYNKIVVSADSVVGQGDDFWVGVTLADKYGNTRVKDSRFVAVSANKLGVRVPVGDVQISSGIGGFWANSSGWSGTGLTFTVRDIVDSNGVTSNATGGDFFVGSASIRVDGTGSTVLDAPDELIAADYKGASGAGDQGGFVILTFDASDDHASLSGYRITRKIAVFHGPDSTGALVALTEPTTALVPWGVVDAVPGQSTMRVVVATLDGDSTSYGVAAERGRLSSKQAFDGAESVSNPYEIMAQTMLQSRDAAATLDAGPVFATLTPEALAFDAQGVIPSLNKVVDGVMQSNVRLSSNAVRAIDDIAPEAVPTMRVLDTPGDAGGSISVQWARSADDRMMTTTVANAVGGSSYSTPGVTGYNIYRWVGTNSPQLVGKAGPGETSFTDATVFNGVRYRYDVRAHDADNVTESGISGSAMAIRNNVVDADGKAVFGLFGSDTVVDYDDFFIFADHFGLGAGDEAFDPAFDLSQNNRVDYDDFFVFADNFGRVIAGVGKVVPTMAGLNTDAAFYLDAGLELPRVGEEMGIAVNLEDYVELRGYGLTLTYDHELLEFVGPQVENNILGEAELAVPQAFAQGNGQVTIAAFGDAATNGDLGLNLIFRAKSDIEASYIEITEGALQDGGYGMNQIANPVSIRIETLPEVYALQENYPNPFNPETTIKYQLPEAGDVTLEIYNMLGQVVRTLVSEHQNAGRYVLQWDATNDTGQPLSSGVYFYRIQAGGEFQSYKKMLLLK